MIAALISAMLASGAAAQEAAIARIKTTDGRVVAIRDTQETRAEVGRALQVGDIVETREGSAGITFQDGTRISLGPDSRLEIKRFAYAPAEGNLALLVRLARGTMLYVSGVIAKLSPEAVKVETPVATIAVRGTRFVAKVEG
jgi:hypothetical protein